MQMVISLLFTALILALFVLSVIYVSRRLAFYFGSEKRKFWYIGISALYIYMVLGWMAFQNSTGTVTHLLYLLAAHLMGFLLYLILTVLLVGLIRKFIKLKPLASGIMAVGLALLLVTIGSFVARGLKTSRMEIPLKGLKQEMKVMHLTDIHLGHIRGEYFIKDIVKRTNAEHVDLVFITGDYIDGNIALGDKYFSPLKQLNAPAYFVGGNHDEYTELEEVNRKMAENGVRVLENEIVDLENVQILGLTYMMADKNSFDMHPSTGKKTIQEVLAGVKINEEKPAILLHHSPVGVNYAAEAGADLYLAGHTHGGQVFPVTLLNKLFFPYSRGLFNEKNIKVYVSQGAGTFGPPIRLGTASEITVITLAPEK